MPLSMQTTGRRLAATAALLLGVLIGGASVAGAVAQISRFVLGNGANGASSATYAVRSTLGQALSGTAQGTSAQIGTGLWTPPPAAPTGVGDEPALALPKVFRLHQNSPNPFNPRTSIPFDLPEAADRVAVRIYDAAGRAVTTVMDAALPAGRQSVIWTGTDDHGRAVASGTYYCVVQTPRHRATTKLTLVR
jgi:hypothetical protein